MKNFKKKPIIVAAEQYTHGKKITGVSVINPEIIFSRDEKLFYVSHTDRPRDWLTVEKKSDGKYEAFPFAQWSIKSGKREPINSENKHLVDLYLKMFELDFPVPSAFIEQDPSENLKVKDGEWVICHKDEYSVMTDSEFKYYHDSL